MTEWFKYDNDANLSYTIIGRVFPTGWDGGRGWESQSCPPPAKKLPPPPPEKIAPRRRPPHHQVFIPHY